MIALQFEQKHCVAKAISVLTSLACTNWLAPNLGARNDLVSVFHQTLTLCEGAGGARLTNAMLYCKVIGGTIQVVLCFS